MGDELTGADIQLPFVAQTCLKFCGRDTFPNTTAFADRIEVRPAYRRAMEKGGA
jgi:glutathione S-transferase